jgi:integrase
MSSASSRKTKVEAGLWRRETASGPRFDVVLWVDGKLTSQTLPSGTSEMEARRAVAKQRAARDSGDRQAVSSRRTFREVAEERLHYAEQSGELKPPTIEKYRDGLAHALPVIGTRKLRDLSRRDLIRVVEQARKEGLAEWTIHSVVTACRSVVRYALERELLSVDPFGRLPRGVAPQQQRKHEAREPLTAAEIDLLLSTCPDTYRRAVELAAFTGLRVSEVCGLTWAAVNLLDGTLSVSGQLRNGAIVSAKSKRSKREIGLVARARQCLEAQFEAQAKKGYASDSDFVFTTGRGTPLNRHNLRNRGVSGPAKKAGLGAVVFHDLRRTAASHFALVGIRDDTAAEMLGHDVVVYRETYVQPLEREKRHAEALAQLEAAGFGGESD